MVIINGRKYDLRSLKGQGRRAGKTCPPDRRTADTNIRTAVGQKREKGKRCNPTANEFSKQKKDKKSKKDKKPRTKSKRKSKQVPVTDTDEEEEIKPKKKVRFIEDPEVLTFQVTEEEERDQGDAQAESARIFAESEAQDEATTIEEAQKRAEDLHKKLTRKKRKLEMKDLDSEFETDSEDEFIIPDLVIIDDEELVPEPSPSPELKRKIKKESKPKRTGTLSDLQKFDKAVEDRKEYARLDREFSDNLPIKMQNQGIPFGDNIHRKRFEELNILEKKTNDELRKITFKIIKSKGKENSLRVVNRLSIRKKNLTVVRLHSEVNLTSPRTREILVEEFFNGEPEPSPELKRKTNKLGRPLGAKDKQKRKEKTKTDGVINIFMNKLKKMSVQKLRSWQQPMSIIERNGVKFIDHGTSNLMDAFTSVEFNKTDFSNLDEDELEEFDSDGDFINHKVIEERKNSTLTRTIPLGSLINKLKKKVILDTIEVELEIIADNEDDEFTVENIIKEIEFGFTGKTSQEVIDFLNEEKEPTPEPSPEPMPKTKPKRGRSLGAKD